MRRLLRILVKGFVIFALVVLLSLAGAYRAIQSVPEFYDLALQVESDIQQQAGDQLEHDVLALRNEARRAGAWQAVFSDEQVNGWLAADLPEKFPDLLPPEFRDPRVSFGDRRARIACRYEDDKLRSVVSLECEPFLTDEPNVLALRLCRARAGMVPVPLDRVKQGINQGLLRAQVRVEWQQIGSDPVALITLPRDAGDGDQNLCLEQCEIRRGELVLAGTTLSAPSHRQGPSTGPDGDAAAVPLETAVQTGANVNNQR